MCPRKVRLCRPQQVVQELGVGRRCLHKFVRISFTSSFGPLFPLIVNNCTEWPESYAVDTSNVLFILSGAFVGLENIIKKRMAKGVRLPFDLGPCM